VNLGKKFKVGGGRSRIKILPNGMFLCWFFWSFWLDYQKFCLYWSWCEWWRWHT